MTKEQFQIRNRWTNAVQVTAEIDCDPSTPISVKLGLAIKWGVANGSDLSGSNLRGSDLSNSDLSGSNLRRSDLSNSDLSGSNLRRSDLSNSDLSGSNLRGSDLSNSDLSGSNLRGSDLSDSDLSGSNLRGSDLSNSDLSGSNLRGSDLSDSDLSGSNLPPEVLRSFKADLWATLIGLKAAPLEIAHLIEKLRAGEVDGSTYGERVTGCACLVGTLAQPRKVDGESLDHNANRPAERWFMMIRPGDRPDAVGADGKETGGGYAARMALEWTLELCERLGFDPATVAPAQTVADPSPGHIS